MLFRMLLPSVALLSLVGCRPRPAGGLDVNFDDKIHLVGASIEPELAPPGTIVKMRWTWRCDAPVGPGWELLTHVHDDLTDQTDNLDLNGPLRSGNDNPRSLAHWKAGETYVDEQTYQVPSYMRGSTLTVMVGAFNRLSNTGGRLPIVSGPNDGHNRAIAATIHTGLGPAK